MSSLFSIGVNGLQAHQAALNVTGQNITNASTPGYSRQRPEMIAQTGSLAAGIFSGAGVRVDEITRIADDYIGNQIRIDQALSSELGSFSRSVGQLEGALYNDGNGIDSALREFFDALQNASNNPLDTAARQFVIGRAGGLTLRFNNVTQRIEQQRLDINGALGAGAARVNELSHLLAGVNQRIAALQDRRDADGLNAMIDERDVLLKELSSHVGINSLIQDDGQASVFVAKGQALVLDGQVAELSVDNKGAVFIRPVGTASQQEITSTLSGGDMGGLLSYRARVLDEAQDQLGQVAASIAHAFNTQHRLGIDLQGDFGGDFFIDLNDPDLVGQRVGYLTGEMGASDIGRVNVYIDDPLSHPAASYEVRVEADGGFTVNRQSDGALVYQGSGIEPPMSVEFDGLRVEFADGSFNAGDTMLLRPYASFASEMGVVLNDPTALALGAPVAFSASAANTGSGVMSVAEITDPDHPVFSAAGELYPPLLVRFVSETQYQILDNTDATNPQPLLPDLGLQTYSPGRQNHVLPYPEGTALVTSSGPQVATLPAVADLVSDLTPGSNAYPAGTATSTYAGGAASISLASGSSAADIAAALNSLSGVSASASTTVSLSNLVNYESGVPVEMAVNGQLLTGFATLNDLADTINADPVLQSQGIVARSDGQVLSLTALSGEDINLHFQGDPNESITVGDTKGGSLVLNGNVAGTYRRVTVGGEISALIAPDTRLSAQLDGVLAANPIHSRADFGFDLQLSGAVAAGDEFAVSFNADAAGDNRNAHALAQLSEQKIIGDPPVTFASLFAGLILEVGSAASQAQVNQSAAEALLAQSESFRESVSGVNLDEEAANLIRFEQAYNASAQVISVARDTFNVLLNAFN